MAQLVSLNAREIINMRVARGSQRRWHMKTLRHALLLGLVLVACSGGTTSLESSAPPAPVKQGEVTGPTSGLTVTASIIAATLGDDCGSSGGFAPSSGDCAPPPDAGAAKAAPGGCGGSFCQQSNVQISFKAGEGSTAAKIEIVSVTLHDATSGSQLDSLTAKNPKAWSGNGYVAWDQTVKPSAETKASYDLTAPAWSKIGSSYSQKFTLHVTLKVDGTMLVLESTTLSREPAVAT
jgi:hypothetical protein